VFALPGVPAEMCEMWNASVAPAVAAALPARRVIRHRRIKCFGAGESDIEAMLPDMIRRKREPLVGITVSGATITLRITASGPDDAACERAMAPTIAQIREILGVLVFGEEDDELEHAVVRLLNQRNQTVAVAEWATDGLVSQWLAEAAGASCSTNSRDQTWSPATRPSPNCFRAGLIVQNAAILRALLHIPCNGEDFASAECASAMATKLREKSDADFGLAIAAFPQSGPREPNAIASPFGPEMTGTLHVALATRDNVRVKGFPLASHPAITKPRSAKQALNMLRLAMLNRSS
jgi:nicotinamide-nucleotide amidase